MMGNTTPTKGKNSNEITERLNMKEEIIKRRNLESLGILAGGIAHDFNNLLAVMLGNISLAKMSPLADNKLIDYMTNTENAILEAKNLTSQLLTFSRGGGPLSKNLDIVKLVKNVTGHTLRSLHINCQYNIREPLPPVFGDETQISIALRHILNNAVESMPQDGTLTIELNVVGPEGLNDLQLEPAAYLKLSILDEGVGIADKNLEFIFDPYFTTKPPGKEKGVGLGLSIVYSIISKHRGHIKIGSLHGQGTRVDIYIPVAETSPEKNGEEEITILPNLSKTDADTGKTKPLRILVMDDEHFIRELLKQMAAELGYLCDTSSDGTEMINLYRYAMESDNPFDVVLMDFTIKEGLGGKTTIQKLLDLDPNAYAIVTSGYSNDEILENYLHFGFKGALPKPYTISELKAVLGI